MLVFLSWSGDRSKAVAEVFGRWLSQVIQAVEPWISVDISKGIRWAPEVTDKLEASRVGIICLTPENVESPWLLFEAGALSKTRDAYVCTFLVDMDASDVEPPLAQFQHTTDDKLDVGRLLRTINAAVARAGERALSEAVLTDVFETFWPRLHEQLAHIAASRPPAAPPARSDAEILDELLTTVRNLERRQVAETEDRKLLSATLAKRHRYGDRWVDLGSLIEPLSTEHRRSVLNYITYLSRTAGRKEMEWSEDPASDVEEHET